MPTTSPGYADSRRPHRSYDPDDDAAADDPAWYSAPRGSLRPTLPASILKKGSAASMTSSSATDASSTPTSPQTRSRATDDDDDARVNSGRAAAAVVVGDDGDDDDDNSDDYFPPLQQQQQQQARRSMQVSISMRSSRAKQRLSLPLRQSLSSAPVLPSPPTSPLSSRTGSSARESLSFDMRPSLDAATGSNPLSASGYRESMQRYRPSDVSAHDMTHALLARDSLAVDAAELLSSSRGSVSHFGARQSADALPDFLRAARTGNLLALKAALQDPATDVAQREPTHGQTALHLAVRFGHFAAVKLLCQKRSRRELLDSRDQRANTPLHLAAAKSRRVTKFLLEQGADVACANARGQTALGVHILTARRDEPLVAEMLLQHKADPNAPLDASTLLHRAVELSLYEIAYRLVRHGARLDIKDEHERMVFDKVNRKVLRQLFSKIAFPPVWVPDADRAACMLCARAFGRFGLGVRRHHCRHCGRLCCGQCSHVSVESGKFPASFAAGLQRKRGSKAARFERVCKTCNVVFREREEPLAEGRTWSDDFVQKVVGITWEEMEGSSQQLGSSRRSSVV